MVITKTLLTEILLEVTNEEVQQVARETHRKATKGLISSSSSHITCARQRDMFRRNLFSLYSDLSKMDICLPLKQVALK